MDEKQKEGYHPWNEGKTMGLGIRHPFYQVWVNIKTRCYNPKYCLYHRYGGRGIAVCGEWKVFKNFYKDMFSSYKRGLSLDRIDNNKGYFKENCRWATAKEQANNTIKIERALRYTYLGITKTIKEWAEIIGIKRTTLDKRLRVYKWPIGRALGGVQFE